MCYAHYVVYTCFVYALLLYKSSGMNNEIQVMGYTLNQDMEI